MQKKLVVITIGGILFFFSGFFMHTFFFVYVDALHTPEDRTTILLPPPQNFSHLLKAEYFEGGPPPFSCDDDDFHQSQDNSSSSSSSSSTHLARYTDKANNTVDVYCQWNDFIQDGERLGIVQFIGLYNNKTVIGQCPFDQAWNYYDIRADERGIINATTWISTTPDMKHSVTYNLTFNDYNQSAMAHRNVYGYEEDIAARLFSDSHLRGIE